MRSIRVHNRVAAITVLQVLMLATLKKHATEYDKNMSNAGRRTETNTEESVNSIIATEQLSQREVRNSNLSGDITYSISSVSQFPQQLSQMPLNNDTAVVWVNRGTDVSENYASST
jgi:hypothetical protein